MMKKVTQLMTAKGGGSREKRMINFYNVSIGVAERKDKAYKSQVILGILPGGRTCFLNQLDGGLEDIFLCLYLRDNKFQTIFFFHINRRQVP